MTGNVIREVVEQIHGQPASDGAGVNLLRVFGGTRPQRFDPFLMLDEFGSEEASDYIGGFPSHPHRGFETVTYMLQGKMEHRDHMGNVGLLNDSDVQWMTAGRGVIHSEMPKQTEGKMRGFQLWVNLPAAQKMKPAYYEDVPGNEIPAYQLNKLFVKAIAGKACIDGQQMQGYFTVPDTDALFLDVHLQPNSEVTMPVAQGYNLLVYVYEGEELLLGSKAVKTKSQMLSRFNPEGDLLVTNNGEHQARFIVLAGKPIKEPIVQHGPFVMNTVEEIQQAVRDYDAGVLTA